MSYSQFSISQRAKLEILHAQGCPTKVIAQELGCHHSSVARRLKRNKETKVYEVIQHKCRMNSGINVQLHLISDPLKDLISSRTELEQLGYQSKLQVVRGLKVPLVFIFFADPYSSWQRGTNENANGLFRGFIPKGHDFAMVTDCDLYHALDLIINRPRKCLGWKTACES